MLTKNGKPLKKSARDKISLENYWNDELKSSFFATKEVIKAASQNSLKLYDPSARLEIYTDASSEFWSSFLILVDDSGERFPMFFNSGQFTKSEIHWSVSSKELYPIIRSLMRWDFITLSHPDYIHLYTDHRNLIFLLSPPSSSKVSTIGRLFRWVKLIQNFKIEAHFLQGADNVIADLLSRWGYPKPRLLEESPVHELQVVNGKAVFGSLIVPLESKVMREFVAASLKADNAEVLKALRVTTEDHFTTWMKNRISFLSPLYKDEDRKNLDLAEAFLANMQLQFIDEKPEGSNVESGIIKKEGKVWIPGPFLDNFCIALHIAYGHASAQSELEIIDKEFYTGKTKVELKEALQWIHQTCLNCDKYPLLVRRPLHQIPHGRQVNEILHADYLSISGSYLLVIVEDLSRAVQLNFSSTCDAETVVNALIRYKAQHSLPEQFTLITDNGSHFCNQIIKRFQELVPFLHRTSVVYSPWTNGSAESVNAIVVRRLRALCSQYLLDESSWMTVIPLLESYINNTPNPRRFGFTPNQIRGGIKSSGQHLFPGRNQSIAVRPDLVPVVFNWQVVTPVNEKRVREHHDKIHKELDAIADKVFAAAESRRVKANGRLNENIVPSNMQYSVGDFVMISVQSKSKSRDKIRLTWNGPYLIEEITGHNVYKVSSPFGKSEEVHAARIKFYDGSDFKVSEEVKKQYLYNCGRFEVDAILSLRFANGDYQFYVKWKGFPEQQGTFEDAAQLFQDVPQMVKEFLRGHAREEPLAEYLYKVLVGEFNYYLAGRSYLYS